MTDPLWQPLWIDACALCPEDFTQADLGMVFKILKGFRQVFIQEQIADPESFRVVLSKELEMASLGSFNVDSLLNSSPTDLCLPELREEIRSLLREKRGVQ
ncbi:MAG: hypothetical protein EPO64_08215 [Nitrospirae bacterium]|nr:MAG: hypothetical protein EPO64_08215 [Nitrospirota bacterium]